MKPVVHRSLVLALGAALASAFLLSQCPHPPASADAGAPAAAARVSVGRSQMRQIEVVQEGIGTVRSRRRTEIAARILAAINEVAFEPGDRVEAGAVLIQLDDRDLRSRLAQAEAQLLSQAAALAEAQTEFERIRSMRESETTTQQEFDLARFSLSRAEAQKTLAESAVEETRILLGFSHLTAPFAGIIDERHVDPGDMAQPGKPLLGLYDPDQLRLEALVNEELLWKIELRQRLPVSVDALGRELLAEVTEIVPAVDPLTRTGTIKLDLPREAPLKPGMFGRVRIKSGTRQAVVVPETALVQRGQLDLVFAAMTEAGQMRATLLLVRAGAVLPMAAGDPPLVEILGGLAADTPIVIRGARALRDGSPLAVDESAAEPRRP